MDQCRALGLLDGRDFGLNWSINKTAEEMEAYAAHVTASKDARIARSQPTTNPESRHSLSHGAQLGPLGYQKGYISRHTKGNL